MSLIMLDDDSSDEMAIDSAAGDANDPEAVELNEEQSNDIVYDSDGAALSTDEKSCEPETAENAEHYNETPADRPILELMKHLINYNGKQNTTLTNSQLIGILKNEFGIDVTNLHYISVDIYMNVLKKFLKDWPQWDEFDRIMHESRCMNDNEEIERMLESEYQSLKDYLAQMLKMCKPWAREAAKRVKRRAEIPGSSRSVPGDVILEVNCTRKQLNTLIFRKPHPEYNSSIFNVDNRLPSRINLKEFTLKAILNWSHISVTINMNSFKYKRELVHIFKHTLVNKKLNQQAEDTALNRHLQTTKPTKKERIVTKHEIFTVIKKILCSNRYNYDQQKDIETVFQVIKDDINIIKDSINLPSSYRYFMNPHRYVRHLYQDVETESDKYDLQLEEKVSPRLKFHFSRLHLNTSVVNSDVNWIKLECTICGIVFVGVAGIEQLKNHFRDTHQDEPDWMCMNCDETFTANSLALMRWYHECPRASQSSQDFKRVYDSDSSD